MSTMTLEFEKSYQLEDGTKKNVLFEKVTFEGGNVTLQVIIDGEVKALKNTGDQTTSSLDKIQFKLPFTCRNGYGEVTLFSSVVYYRELKQWKKAIDALKTFGISPVSNEAIRLVTYGTHAHEDLEFEVNRHWLATCLKQKELVEDAEDVEIFIRTYTHDDSYEVYVAAKESQQILAEEVYC